MSSGRVVAVLALLEFSIGCSAQQSGEALNKAARLYAQGRYDEAVSAYRESIRFYPQNGYAYCGMGNALRELHKLSGVTLVETGAYAEATIHLTRAVAMKPENPWPRIYSGIALAATKD